MNMQDRQDDLEALHARSRSLDTLTPVVLAACAGILGGGMVSFNRPDIAQAVLVLGVAPVLLYGLWMFGLTGAVVLHRFYMHIRRKK